LTAGARAQAGPRGAERISRKAPSRMRAASPAAATSR